MTEKKIKGALTVAAGLILANAASVSPALATPPLCTTSIFSPNTVPALQNNNDGPAIEVGTKFQSTFSGDVIAARFYMGASNNGACTATLWTAGGTPLGSALLPAFVGPGWNEVAFSSPIPINANQTYVISVYSPDGWYEATHNVFDTAVVNPPLRGLAAGEDGPNGVYSYGGGFPTSSYLNSSYLVDVVLESECPYDLSWFTIDCGGGTSTNGLFFLSGTSGQPDAGRMTGPPYFSLVGGYWGAAGAAPTCPADFNDDGLVDDEDFVLFANMYNILLCDAPEMPPDCPGDLNGDQEVNDEDFVIFANAYNELLCP
ncbi:MAG: DUF4082 domain-containing protein [Phycisphaeraceae bacterium]|nr:DUF4082 domain-containing protein [Phycisphaeraceae bacterium]